MVTTLAGSGTSGSSDGTGSEAKFSGASGIAVDSDGNIYVTDTGNNKIRKITPAGVVTTLPASGFNSPRGIIIDSSGNIYVANTNGSNIRKIPLAGEVSVLASGFLYPHAIGVDSSDNVYAMDDYARLYKITPVGVKTTIAGSTHGYLDGTIAEAKFNQSFSLAVDGNEYIYVADSGNNCIRKVKL
ncbi:hypothetical protein AGMMS49940_10010 [Spirochaetia bacterium]|nr:hypothetical protein AGMMS49940_10010 [Spirochaetia bacterium]